MNTELVLMDKPHGIHTTSLIVAEIFNKEHKNVLRDIETLECSDDFNRLNFELISYLDSMNREQKAYNITKDGFSLLITGFTGKEAMGLIEKFFDAFNRKYELLNDPEYIIELGYKYALENFKKHAAKHNINLPCDFEF